MERFLENAIAVFALDAGYINKSDQILARKVNKAVKLRRLQCKDEKGQWYDDAYVYEDEDGQLIFCCNLTWESVGRRYYRKFKEAGVRIEAVETVLFLDGQTMRWLPVEVIESDQVETLL